MRYLVILALFVCAPALAQDAAPPEVPVLPPVVVVAEEPVVAAPDAGSVAAPDVVEAPDADAAVTPDAVKSPEAADAGTAPVADAAAPASAPDAGNVVPDAAIEGPSMSAAPPGAMGKAPETDAEVGALVSQMLEAAKSGHWTVFFGALLLLLVYGFNKLGMAKQIGRTWVPWATLGIGAVVAVAAGLAQGAPVLESVKLGLLEGGVAIALWELVFKHFTAAKSDGSDRA